MASYDNTYSRFIALARIVLPLAALGVLSTLFLASPGPDQDQTIPYTRGTIEQIAREQRIGAPQYAGVTADGTAIAMTTDVARPDPTQPGRATAEIVRLRLDMPNGSHTQVAADTGTVDLEAGQTVLEGGVLIESSTGYRLMADRVTAALDDTDIATDGPVQGKGPAGQINAGQMRLTTPPQTPGQYLLVFKDGVKLIYQPDR